LKTDLWAERRRAILLAADAIESRDGRTWSQVDDLLFQVRSARPNQSQTLKAKDAAKRIQELLDNPAEDTFPLPFDKLNKCLLGGLRRGQTMVLAADPAHGKSVLADQILEHAARAGANCHLLMNEMQPMDRAARWIQRATGIHEEKVLSRNLNELEREQIVREAETFPFDMTSIAGDSFRDVADRLRDTRPDVAVVDLLSRFDYRDERELRLGVTTLTDAAHQTRCALILCHHLNEKRVSDRGSRPTPSLTDIRDSGSVKNFADSVMFLNREHDPEEPTKLLTTGDVYLAKVRAGKTGGVKVRLNTSRLRFELSAAPEQAAL
jgi:replicative DNA helicase